VWAAEASEDRPVIGHLRCENAVLEELPARRREHEVDRPPRVIGGMRRLFVDDAREAVCAAHQLEAVVRRPGVEVARQQRGRPTL
jgi:hypothetical protein